MTRWKAFNVDIDTTHAWVELYGSLLHINRIKYFSCVFNHYIEFNYKGLEIILEI